MFEIQENYEEIKFALNDLLNLIKKMNNKIEIDGTDYKLEFYLGSDYKMLRCLYGHKSPNASEGCVWCHCDLRKDIITFEDAKNLQNLKKNKMLEFV